VTIGPDGKFVCPLVPPLQDGDKVVVTVEDPAGNVSPGQTVEIDRSAPDKPIVDPSNGTEITGTGEPGSDAVVKDPVTGEELCRVTIGPDGKFKCVFKPPLEDGKQAVVTVVDPAGNVSPGVTITIDSNIPQKPTVNPSDGTEFGGTAEPGSTVIVTDDSGEEIGRAVADPDGNWTIKPDKPVTEGETIHVVSIDAAGNRSNPVDWRVGLPRVDIQVSPVPAGQRETGIGRNFQPGEKVHAEMFSDPFVIGDGVVGPDGTVVLTWNVPRDTTAGTHRAEFNGELSGVVNGSFEVTRPQAPAQQEWNPYKPLPFTGTNTALPIAGIALGALLAGLLLLLAARRRRHDEEE
jgi:LPXTG-motif cell wall-anchored protein